VSAVGPIVGRNLRRTLRMPRLLALSVFQPVVIALLFLVVLEGAVHTPGPYVDYLMPAIAIQATLFGATTAVAMAVDLQAGMLDRFRSMPVSAAAVLGARAITDVLRTGLALAVLSAVAIGLGFQLRTGVPQALAALALILLFAFAVSWLLALIGLLAGDPESAQVAGLLPFPVLFVSSAFVPVETMPAWLQPLAGHQPVSVTIDSVRALTQGGEVLPPLWQSLAWIAVGLALAVPLTLLAYRRA
jgi:ABC transporter DrrB family efflux protein